MARLGRAQPTGVFVPVRRPRSGPNNNTVTASDTLATITDVATRISHVSLKASDTLAADTDTATRVLGGPYGLRHGDDGHRRGHAAAGVAP